MIDLYTKDIVEIIKACRKEGVAALDFGDLHLRFAESAAETVKLKGIRPDPVTEARRIPEMEIQVREHELEELRLRDPYEYEQLVAQNELTNDRQANP